RPAAHQAIVEHIVAGLVECTPRPAKERIDVDLGRRNGVKTQQYFTEERLDDRHLLQSPRQMPAAVTVGGPAVGPVFHLLADRNGKPVHYGPERPAAPKP